MIKVALTIWVIVLTLSICGWGAAFAGLLRLCPNESSKLASWRLPQLFVMGVFLLTFLGLISNFFFPLTKSAGALVIALGLLATLKYRNLFGSMAWLSVVAGVLWVTCGLPYDGFFNDAGLYHLQVEEWIAESKLLLGWANLHSRFGFDSMWLMFVAETRIDLAPMLPVGMHAIVADMTLRAFVFWWLLLHLEKSLERNDKFSIIFFSFAFGLLSLILWRMRSAGTDVPANLLVLALWLLVYEYFKDRDRSVMQTMVAICLAALIVTFKLSIVPMALLAVPIMFGNRLKGREILVVGFVALTYIGAWILRNYITTGCLVYPVSFTCRDVAWGLGIDQARSEALITTMFARQHLGPNLQAELAEQYLTDFNLKWLGVWLTKFPKTYYFHLMAGYFTISSVAYLWLNKRYGVVSEGSKGFIATFLIAIMGFVFWLLLGPDPRFSWSVFFVLSMCFIGFGFNKLSEESSGRHVRKPLVSRTFGGLILISIFLGVSRSSPINFEQYRVYGYQDQKYNYMPLDYRGLRFYVASLECGDRIPCIMNNVTHKSLDKFIDANQGTLPSSVFSSKIK